MRKVSLFLLALVVVLFNIRATDAVCNAGSKSLINMCIQVFGKFMDAHTGHSINGLCNKIPAKDQCRAMVKWIFTHYQQNGWNDRQLKTAVVNGVRTFFNIHNFCAEKLGTIPANAPQRANVAVNAPLLPSPRADCKIPDPPSNLQPAPSHTGGGIHSLTGLRCLLFHGVGSKYYNHNAKNDLPGVNAGPTILAESQLADDQNYNGQFGDKYVARSDKESKSLLPFVEKLCDWRFFKANTLDRPWSDQYLQREYCMAIEHYNPQVIFTHSMGNLIIAGGIARGLAGCSRIKKIDAIDFDPTLLHQGPVLWFGVQGPLEGTPVIYELKKICAYTNNEIGGLHIENRVAWQNMRDEERCDFVVPNTPSNQNRLKGAYLSMEINPDGSKFVNPLTGYGGGEPYQPQLECPHGAHANCRTLKWIATHFQSGSTCGTSTESVHRTMTINSLGLWRMWSYVNAHVHNTAPAMPALDKKNNRDNNNLVYGGFDGCLPYSSCAIPSPFAQYYGSYKARYYSAQCNHEEALCPTGDRDWHRSPCAYYQEMIKLARQRFNLPAAPDLYANFDANIDPAQCRNLQFPAALNTVGFGFMETHMEGTSLKHHRQSRVSRIKHAQHPTSSHHNSPHHAVNHHRFTSKVHNQRHHLHVRDEATDFLNEYKKAFIKQGDCSFQFDATKCETECEKHFKAIFPKACPLFQKGGESSAEKKEFAVCDKSKINVNAAADPCDAVNELCGAGCTKLLTVPENLVDKTQCQDEGVNAEITPEFMHDKVDAYFASHCQSSGICQDMCHYMVTYADDLDDAGCADFTLSKKKEGEYLNTAAKTTCAALCKKYSPLKVD